MAVRPEEESRQLQSEAHSLDRKARAAVSAFGEKLAQDRLSQVKLAAVGEAHVAILQLDRLSRRLILLGEPAGRDFSMRVMALRSGLEVANQEVSELTSQQARFSAEVGAAIAALIEADAGRTDPSVARAMLAAYLERLAPLVALSADDSLGSVVAPALEKLASKSPELAAEVEAYRKATTDVLRWRRRTAEASARARKGDFSPIHEEFLRAVRATDLTPGLVPTEAIDTSRAEFSAPVPGIMGPAVEKLMGRRVWLTDLVGLPTKTRITIARYGKRSYARFSVPDALAARFSQGVAALESDLLVSESAPPLTLEAAVALAKARRGDLASAGGEITGLALESLVTRFAALSNAGRTLIPLGPLPEESGWRDRLRQAVMQFEIEPAWVRHECFFVGGE